MPVDTPRKEYGAALERWTRCRDVADGGDCVKAKKELYLPRVSKRQKVDAYEAYLKRASFYGATSRTIQGLSGAIFGKAPVVQVPNALDADRVDVTQSGVSLEAFARDVVTELLTVGRHGVLVDMASDGGAETRPYWVPFLAHNIINWRTTVRSGDTILTRVVLRECAEESDPADPYGSKEVEQFRVLQLDARGLYEVLVLRRVGDAKEWAVAETLLPTRRGERLPFIPFQFFGPSRLTTDIERPPLLDLVDKNIEHYQLSADRRQMLHYMGQVQAWISGIDKKDAPTTWGSGNIWTMAEPTAQAGLLQVGADGAAPLRDAVADIEQHMAVLGARFLEAQVTKQEAADTVRMRRSGDAVVQATIGQTASLGLSNLLRWHAWWASAAQDPKDTAITIALNTDFLASRLTADEIKALVLAVQAGRISGETFYHALQRGDWAEPGVDYDTEKQRIAAGEPPIEEPEPTGATK